MPLGHAKQVTTKPMEAFLVLSQPKTDPFTDFSWNDIFADNEDLSDLSLTTPEEGKEDTQGKCCSTTH
jgi:hypothetical protein